MSKATTVVIKPRFNALNNNALYFHVGDMNALAREEYQDNFGFYQRTFGVYSYMRMTKDLKFVLHYPKDLPFKWQAHNSCAWTPLGTMTMGTKEIEPCRVKLNEQFCYDEWFDSTYKYLLDWSSGAVKFDAVGQNLVDSMARTIVKNATIGFRMLLVGGQLYSGVTPDWTAGTPARVQDAFLRTANVCKGWIKLLIDLAASDEDAYGHLDNGLIDAGDIGPDGLTFTGNVVDLYDAMYTGAPRPLQIAIQTGGVGGFDNLFYPIAIVSRSILAALHLQYIAQNEAAAQNMPRITVREYSVDTERDVRPIRVYFIDNTAFVPLDEIDLLEGQLETSSHFFYLTLSGVIQLGSSFMALPVANEADVAVMVQLSTDVEDLGTYKFAAHALAAVGINDTDYITGDYFLGSPD